MSIFKGKLIGEPFIPLGDTKVAETPVSNMTLIKPHVLAKKVGDYVIGNEDAIQTLCVGIYNHYKRINHNSKNNSDVEIDKSNILLIGGTGSGKTYILKTICRFLDIPFFVADASTLTAAGYVGADTESILSGLYLAADGNMERAEKGIIVIDEIDKISNKEENISITRDVSGLDVQYELLKIMEGTTCAIQPGEKRKHPEKPTISFNTNNVLFVCMGAFEGIEKMIKKRMNIKRIGYKKDNEVVEFDENKIFSYANQDDLRTYGLIRELIGRLPIITSTEILSKETLKDILTKPKNNIIEQYKVLFKMDGCKLTFDEDALNVIADYSIKNKSGARSLRATLEKILKGYMFDIPRTSKKTLIITEKIVKEKLGI